MVTTVSCQLRETTWLKFLSRTGGHTRKNAWLRRVVAMALRVHIQSGMKTTATAKMYKVKRTDGTVISVTIPPKECSDCSGEGRRWNDAADRFDNAVCPTCNGNG